MNSILKNKNLFFTNNKNFLIIKLTKSFLFNSSKFFKKDKYMGIFLRKIFSYMYFFNFLSGFLPKLTIDIKYIDLKKKKKNLKINLISYMNKKTFFSFLQFISFFNYLFEAVFIESEWYFLRKKNVIYLGLKNFMFLDQFFLKNYKDFFYQEKNFIFFKIIFKKNLEIKWFQAQLLKILNEKK